MADKKDTNKFTWSKGDTQMLVNGQKGKFVNGKFVPTKNKQNAKKK